MIGVGLRFPGNASSPEKLWDVLEQGESQWCEIPKERINIAGYFHPSGDRQGSVSAQYTEPTWNYYHVANERCLFLRSPFVVPIF